MIILTRLKTWWNNQHSCDETFARDIDYPDLVRRYCSVCKHVKYTIQDEDLTAWPTLQDPMVRIKEIKTRFGFPRDIVIQENCKNDT